MKWFEHHTDDRDKAHVKILRAKFGAEGYGIYMALIEVIGENVTDTNTDDWGCVAKIHDLDSLAVECATTKERLKEFLEFCNDKEIFEKKDGLLYSSLILERLDNYAKRIHRKISLTKDEQPPQENKQSTNSVRTKYEQSSTKFGQSTNKVQLSTTLQKQKQKQVLAKANGDQSPTEEFGNEIINHVLREFERIYGFQPTDKYPRRVAHNLEQRMSTITGQLGGGEVTNARVKAGITKFFDWLNMQDGLEGIQNLETAKRKLNVFISTLPKGKHVSN